MNIEPNEDLSRVAEHITEQGLNFFGAEFEYLETGETFNITVSKVAALKTLNEENQKLQEQIVESNNKRNESSRKWRSQFDAKDLACQEARKERDTLKEKLKEVKVFLEDIPCLETDRIIDLSISLQKEIDEILK